MSQILQVMKTPFRKLANRFNWALTRVLIQLRELFIGAKRLPSLEISPIKTRLLQIMRKGLMPGLPGVRQERFLKFMISVEQ